ncbi:hypothetical protein DTO013E5_4098 [Penicillium roqueforti]|uniref:uncharacterized protein n=1 Tax=Penicillium roqueforti TaxID=5082 RepID=UPI00190A4DB1|nr:uncharacterized protein LCP9604111_1472 [Penicillium roqueforti]KAF9251476.1 hypothetical protein LCP9604111_1472 [Penicillium roqueforti]KAI1836712.1 hypothetical protein CBS147337_2939 [Penicillium roqueforti]KAI2685151.1 hypothetical protein LCP963914a_4478 [Penicillium roqueforti]KAI2690517.1 hypothetical protein CBS147355_968 [Penicillium roqueforti]KAI2695990.1 hypothetical protein CBS147372_8705 [Penicillium roqueforti]
MADKKAYQAQSTKLGDVDKKAVPGIIGHWKGSGNNLTTNTQDIYISTLESTTSNSTSQQAQSHSILLEIITDEASSRPPCKLWRNFSLARGFPSWPGKLRRLSIFD